MFDLKLPSGGLTISHNHPSSNEGLSKEHPHIIQLNVWEHITKDLLKSIRNNEQVRLKLGKKSTLQYGRKQLNLGRSSNPFPTEVFLGPTDGTGPVYFSGKLSHTLEVQKAKQDTAASDEALANLENTLKSMKEEQASNEVSFMGSKGEVNRKDMRTAALSNRDRLKGNTAPSTPFLGNSPRLGPTSTPLLSSVPSKEKIRQDAMKIPMIHLLAMSPLTLKAVANKLNTPQLDCERVLDKVAKDGSGGNKELKDKCYRELDVWKFPYPTQEDRQAAINRAIHAYDRLRIDKNDQLWQLLLPMEERGKGKLLSRLNFEKPPPAPTPKLSVDAEAKVDASDREGKVKKAKNGGTARDLAHKKTAGGDAVVKKRVEKPPVKSAAQSTKTESKFKSSERIEDSDEEADGVEVAPAKVRMSKTKERDHKHEPSPRPTSSGLANGQHRTKLSHSSISSSDQDRPRLADDRSKLKPRPYTERSPTNSRISPRPRVDSSPQKPSPLGSSPPANSTDMENSSKSSTQSSAPSSPPSGNEMPLSQARKNYSPVIVGKGRNANASKRKAEKNDDPPAKRQQIHGLGLSKTITDKLQQPTPERRPSDTSMSSLDKSEVTQEAIIASVIKFREYYAMYKDLHAKLSRMEPEDRPDSDLEKLRKMHERLEKLKGELWSDWEKSGGEMPE